MLGKVAAILTALLGDKNSRSFVLRRLPKNSVCAELGVYNGVFSRQILNVVQPAKLHLVDPWLFQSSAEFSRSWYGGVLGQNQANMDRIYRSVVDQFRPNIVSGQVEVHRGASAELCSQFPDAYFDWIYIDGDHRYAGVMQDLEMYFPKLKHDGLVAGDDYDNPGWWDGGVSKAVDEVIACGLYRKVLIRNNQFILHKP